jgi:hypothetical protein
MHGTTHIQCNKEIPMISEKHIYEILIYAYIVFNRLFFFFHH